MLALPIEQMSSRSSVSRRPSFYLPDNTEGGEGSPELRRPRQVIVMQVTEGASPMAAGATTSSKAKEDDAAAVSAMTAAAAPATMDEMEAAYRERQQPKGVKSLDAMRRRQWLIDDPSYLRHSVRQLRLGRRYLRRELELTNEAELFENRCLYSSYARSIRHKRERRRRLMRPGSPYGSPSSAGSESPSPAPSSRGWSRGGRWSEEAGSKKSLAQVAVQLRVLTETLQHSHSSLAFKEGFAASQPQRERQQAAELKSMYSSLGDLSKVTQSTHAASGSSWRRSEESIWSR